MLGQKLSPLLSFAVFLVSFRFQMGSRCKKALIAESVRDSLHSWCKRVKERSKATNSITTRSTCSLESTIDEGDEIITVASGTLSPCSSAGSLSHMDANGVDDQECDLESSNPVEHDFSFRHMEHSSETLDHDVADDDIVVDGMKEDKTETLLELFQKTWTKGEPVSCYVFDRLDEDEPLRLTHCSVEHLDRRLLFHTTFIDLAENNVKISV